MKNTFSGKIFIISVILSAFVYFNCDDAGIVDNDNNDFCINAKLSGWIPGNKILVAQIIAHGGFVKANCPVDNEGNFNLCLPPMADSLLYSSDSIFYASCTGGSVTFDPPDVKGTQIYNYRVTLNDTIVGAVDCNNYVRYDSIKAGDFEVGYIYVTKNVTVSGFKVCSDDTLKFNGTAQTGWNKIIKHYTRVNGTSRTILYDMIEPPGAVWEYHGD